MTRAIPAVALASIAALWGACADVPGDAPARVPMVCDDPQLPPQQIRLLTRREYDATVRDLLPFLDASCASDTACQLDVQSCVAGTCEADPCNLVTFILPAPDGPHTSVHVAGTFNGWAATRAGGGWPMTWVPEQRLYYAKRAVPEGTHAYKLVIDDGARWVPDPSNPATTPDGFGGNNSVLVQSCTDAAPPDDANPSSGFPPETRPTGYAFDNHADAGVVTAVHLEQHLAAAERLSARALATPDALLGCDADDDACVENWVRDFGRRAWRRPLTQNEVQRLIALVRGQSTRRAGLDVALRVFLASPSFVYRTELGEPLPDGTFRLTPHELASALSYFLWGTAPDEALLAAADRGELHRADGLETQARRLLADPRARRVVGTFALQWLDLESLPTLDRTPYPAFTDAVRAAMLAETRALFEHVVFDGSQRWQELYTADYTFANDALARLYDLQPPGSTQLAEVAYDDRRAGFLGHGSALAATSHSDQTSPIRRGVWVREALLCQHLPPPPANAGGVPEVDPDATTRERFAQHSADPFCAGCHQHIDDLGFGFERFDPVGAWRTEEPGGPIDGVGMIHGTEELGEGPEHTFVSLPELGALMAGSDGARACLVEQWTRFAVGREVPQDDCSLAWADEQLQVGDGSVQELLIAITQTPSFSLRRTP